MSYIYHIVSKDFGGKAVEGHVLYPLNVLKEKYPAIYAKHAEKYANKKHIQELYIPQLKCYWGDVLHFSAVRPEVVAETLSGLGLEKEFNYYEIDTRLIDQKNAIVYTNRPREDMKTTSDGDFAQFDPDDVSLWSTIPQETIEHYKKKISEGKEPTLFLFIPHILYRGELDVSSLSLKSTL